MSLSLNDRTYTSAKKASIAAGASPRHCDVLSSVHTQHERIHRTQTDFAFFLAQLFDKLPTPLRTSKAHGVCVSSRGDANYFGKISAPQDPLPPDEKVLFFNARQKLMSGTRPGSECGAHLSDITDDLRERGSVLRVVFPAAQHHLVEVARTALGLLQTMVIRLVDRVQDLRCNASRVCSNPSVCVGVLGLSFVIVLRSATTAYLGFMFVLTTDFFQDTRGKLVSAQKF